MRLAGPPPARAALGRTSLVLGVALVGHIPTFASRWCLDDWGQLARAIGLLDRPFFPARWLSQDLWWSLSTAMFGLSEPPHTALRILIHGTTAAFVASLTANASRENMRGLLAGVLFAVSPLAFTPIFWGSGIQELLGGLFGAAALWAWWHPQPRPAVSAACLVLAIFAKETVLALPLVLAAHVALSPREPRDLRMRRAVVVLVALTAAAVESALILRSFDTGPEAAYRIGGPKVWLGNLGVFGWWLGTLAPAHTAMLDWTKAAIGGLGFAAWGAVGVWRWRVGDRRLLATWTVAIASLAPSLTLVQQTHPYLAYGAAAALTVALALSIPGAGRISAVGVAALALAAAGYGFWITDARLALVRDDGLPADAVVRSSWWTAQLAGALDEIGRDRLATGRLVMYQPPLRQTHAREARAKGDRYIVNSTAYRSFGGSLGTDVLLGRSGASVWANSLARIPRDAYVICETRQDLRPWGAVSHAIFNAALTDIATGNFARALDHLTRAIDEGYAADLFIFAADEVIFPPSLVREQMDGFRAHVRAHSAPEIGAAVLHASTVLEDEIARNAARRE